MSKMNRAQAQTAARFWGDLPPEIIGDVHEDVQDLWSELYEDLTERLADLLYESGYDLEALS